MCIPAVPGVPIKMCADTGIDADTGNDANLTGSVAPPAPETTNKASGGDSISTDDHQHETSVQPPAVGSV
jgi:hypothetical protein